MPRELLALAFIEQAQPIHTGHYQRLLEVSQAVAWRSLRKLRDMGLVTVHLTAMEAPNRYTLAPKARPLLARIRGGSPDEFRVMRGIGKVNLEHHDTTVDLHVALQVACARSKHLDLQRFVLERDIRAQLGNRAGIQVPDAVAVLRTHDGQQLALAIETDRATENPNWVARHKSVPYADLWEGGHPVSGCDQWCIACTVPSVRRRNKLVRAMWTEGALPEGLWYFAVDEQITSRNVLGDIWHTLGRIPDSHHRTLIPQSPLQGVRTNCSDRPNRHEYRSTSQNYSENHGIENRRQTGSFTSGGS